MSVVFNEVILKCSIRLECLVTERTLDRKVEYHHFLIFYPSKGKEDGRYMLAASY